MQELSVEKTEEISKMFRAMDTDGDGMVSAGEFERYCRKTEIAIGAERVS